MRAHLKLVKDVVDTSVDTAVETAVSAAGQFLPAPASPQTRSTSATGGARTSKRTKPVRSRVVVIGGGISGLAAAHTLQQDPDVDVTVIEADAKFGGKLREGEIAGTRVDLGAESLLALRPEAVRLAIEMGLQDELEPPVTTQAGVLSRDRIRPMPAGLVSGIPTDLRMLAASSVMSLGGLLRVPLDHLLPQTTVGADVAIGEYVAARLGREVTDRLVEPMLGGVYAGQSDQLSMEMTVPALFRRIKQEKSLLNAAREVRSTGSRSSGARRQTVFNGIRGGIHALPTTLASELEGAGVEMVSGAKASRLTRIDNGPGVPPTWVVRAGRRRWNADAVVLAVPTHVAAELLVDVHPTAASILQPIEYASVAVVSLAYRGKDVPTLPGSGFLVPPIEGRVVKAATYSSQKWGWLNKASKNVFIMRTSVGRFRDNDILELDDREIAAKAVADLSDIAGLPLRTLDAVVTRWDHSLPQYAVGHRDRVRRLRSELKSTPGLAVCGAAYDGVGVAACIGDAQSTSLSVLQKLVRQREAKERLVP